MTTRKLPQSSAWVASMRLFNRDGVVDLVPNAYVWARIFPTIVAKRPPLRARTTIWDDMEYVNSFVNTHLRFMTDMGQWGQEEYWSTVDEILERRTGDCEDFAILKLAGLMDMGYKFDHFCIPVVKQPDGQGHAVLAFVNPLYTPLILDNKKSRVYPDIQADYTPCYAYGYRENWRFQ